MEVIRSQEERQDRRQDKSYSDKVFSEVRLNIYGEQESSKYKSNRIIKFVSIVCVVVILLYAVVVFTKGEQAQYDSLKTFSQKIDLSMTNDLKVFKHYNFIPIIEITNYLSSSSDSSLISELESQSSSGYKYIDYTKLRKYIKIYINQNIKQEGSESKDIMTEFRQCTDKDVDIGSIKSNIKDIYKYLCPDKEVIDDIVRLNNTYKSKDRQSFQIVIVNENYRNTSCDKLKTLIDNIYFTQYVIHEQIEFDNIHNYQKRPTSVDIHFQQQYQLRCDQYRDNNNFIRYNRIETQDNRFQFILDYQQFSFIDIIGYPAWYGIKRIKTYDKVSFDNGKNYDKYSVHILSGQYFFLNNDMMIHQRKVFNFFEFSAMIGGIFGVFYLLVGSVSKVLAYHLFMGYLIKKVYIKDQEEFRQSNSYSNQFTILDQLGGIYIFKLLQILFKKILKKDNKLVKNAEIYNRYRQKMEKDINVLHIIQKLKKVKVIELNQNCLRGKIDLIENKKLEQQKKINFIKQSQDDLQQKVDLIEQAVIQSTKIDYKQPIMDHNYRQNNSLDQQQLIIQLRNQIDQDD